ncbi:transposase [Evansella sp. AB-P1]|uniref:transposase n=1 Tax=Evansella sp. AB-P1 TaxID=3037653 RepID=UPI00241C3EB9|nr:transposase [Evansella sp. AB-P1]MDG5789389.1 transposase [Evansella sp. AB-P1]
MPRKAREKSSTGIYHVMLRGINKQTIFEDDEDKRKFLQTLAKCKEVSGFELYGYCLMDNHIHLLVMEKIEGISTIMMRFSSSYVYWYNKKYDRCGHLFQERFRSESVENAAYFIKVLRYIHQNPLKAGLTKCVWEYEWTSIHEYVNKETLTDVEGGLNYFSSNRKVALEWFVVYMQEKNEDYCSNIEERVKLTDNQVREFLRGEGVTSNSMLQQMDRKKRNAILSNLKKLNGVSVRQLSRITGISKSVIDRLK